jgi:hypothetical protein
MKIKRKHFAGGLAAPNPAPAGEGGSATVILIALLAIMVILVAANSKSLFLLHREVKLLEQQQVKRLDASQTNSVAVTNPDSK